MTSTISIDVNVSDLSTNSVAEMLLYKLSDEDDIQDLADKIFSKCKSEWCEDNLKTMCEAILAKIQT